MKITYLGHASFMVEGENTSVIFDPYKDQSVPGLVFPKFLGVNKVFVSHEHDDHNARRYIKELGLKEKIKIEIEEHNHDKVDGRLRGKSNITSVIIDGLKIVHLGDLGEIKSCNDIKIAKDADILFCPINGFYTIGPKDIKKYYKYLNPRILIPMHYKDRNFGYPDNGMLTLFMQEFKQYKLVNESTLKINKSTKGVYIFNKNEGEIL